MLRLSPGELLQLKGAGGERFAHFVDLLIRAEAAKGGLAQSEVRTQIRVNVRDGGVDTQVAQAVPRDISGWFGVPTCWQFKGVDTDNINDRKYKKKKNSLQEEINKPHARQLITQGYGFRFCLLGDLTPQKLTNWEEQLKVEARLIRPDAVDPRVIHGGDLIAWVERFPAVVAWLRQMTQEVLHWEAWEKNCRAVTRVYVRNLSWEDVREQILRHIDFNMTCVDGRPCLMIGGAAGVGKTRLVFETIRESQGSSALTVYAWDELAARRVAAAVANSPEQSAIIVADECSYESRTTINNLLCGHGDRVRVIGLANTGTRQSADAWLDRESIGGPALRILEENFPEIPEDRRRQYAEVSRGFVRLAADMCQHDLELVGSKMSSLSKRVNEYVKHRLRDHLPLVSLMALFHKVGSRDEVRADVDALCRIANKPRQDFVDAVRAVRDSPGFVVEAGRYWYVTPEIVSRVLFTEGWDRWVRAGLGDVLSSLPGHLHQQLIDRAATFGGEEVRVQLATFFRGWFGRLTTKELADAHAASLASAIIQANPEEYLPRLRAVLDRAAADDLMKIKGNWSGWAWGPRRSLSWLLENLVAFPDFFDDCEACLFRLALHENEPHAGNSAKEIWSQLYCVSLSGTATPFEQRIEFLRARTYAPSLDEARLAFRGLDRVFTGSSGLITGPSEVGGRLRPSDWQPDSAATERGCYLAAWGLCGEHLTGDDPARRALAIDVLFNHVHSLLKRGFLDEIAGVRAMSALKEDEARRLVNAVDGFVAEQERIGRDRVNEPAARYIQEVHRWVDSIRPADFDGKLRSICARDPWDTRFAGDPQTQSDETGELAVVIRSNPPRLVPHLDWLASHEARSAERLGHALGQVDDGFACGEMIFKQAIQWGSAPLLRGYIQGLVLAERRPTAAILGLMEELEAAHPQMAVDILVRGGDDFDALNRVIQLVESGAVSTGLLASFAMGVGRRELSAEDVGRLLPYFIDAATKADADSAQAGVRFLFTSLMVEKRRASPSCIEVEGVRASAWGLADATLPYVGSETAHKWSRIVGQLADYDPRRAAILLGRALLSDGPEVELYAQQQLIQLVSQCPGSAMEGIGRALLNPSQGWRLQIRVLRKLVALVPTETILAWARKHGVDGARAIARHLPLPYLDDEGHPIVPEVLDVIFRDYADGQVYQNFIAGLRWGENVWGLSPNRFRLEAEKARRFLKHPNPRIRQWARYEINECERIAESREREYAEEILV